MRGRVKQSFTNWLGLFYYEKVVIDLNIVLFFNYPLPLALPIASFVLNVLCYTAENYSNGSRVDADMNKLNAAGFRLVSFHFSFEASIFKQLRSSDEPMNRTCGMLFKQ